jgi:hypothetical protein
MAMENKAVGAIGRQARLKGETAMITLEQVEKLRERADVSYEDAKAALEITEGDLLEAVIYLEKQGKINGPEMSSYNTRTGGERDGGNHYEGQRGSRRRYIQQSDGSQYSQDRRQGPTIGQQMNYFWQKLCELVRKTNVNQFEVSKDGKGIISMPITLLIVSLIFFFWVTVPLLVIALFFGCRYRFAGPDFGKDAINNVMDQAADTAESIKRTIMSEGNADNADNADSSDND